MSEQRHTTNEVGDGAENTAAGRNPDGTPCECQRPSGGRCPPWCRHERHEVRDLTDRLCDASVDDRDVSTSVPLAMRFAPPNADPTSADSTPLDGRPCRDRSGLWRMRGV
jgi:hypothetical protein